jgi:hypothetical protein
MIDATKYTEKELLEMIKNKKINIYQILLPERLRIRNIISGMNNEM